jgi:hypothetical protein
MKKRTINKLLTAFVTAFIALTFSSVSMAQTAPLNPHDFSDKFYFLNGVNSTSISGRLTGTDGLSTFDKVGNDAYRSVRVLITIPAYSQAGDLLFFSPLGRITYSGFTDTKEGVEARELARRNPIYIFPDVSGIRPTVPFGGMRQAPVIDQAFEINAREQNPLGIRLVLNVPWTKLAFSTQGYQILKQLAAENGTALDGNPIIKTTDEVKTLLQEGLITISEEAKGGTYAIAPVIKNVDDGGIALDAFLSMVTKDGRPLPSEQAFVIKFECAKKGGC